MIISAYYKPLNKVVRVYDIQYDKSAYPHFLVYINGEWRRISAKHFREVDGCEN